MNNDELKLLAAIKTKEAGLNTPQFMNLQKFKGLVDTPQFPGVNIDRAIATVQAFIRNQKRARGFEFPIIAGNNSDLRIELSGSARMMLGFAITQTESAVLDRAKGMSFTVNNDLIIDNVNVDKFGPEFTDDEFYFYPRPLSGTDTFKLNIVGQNANIIFMTIYYI